MSDVVAIGSTIDEFDVVVLEEGWLHVVEEIYICLVVPALDFNFFFACLAYLQATVVIGRPGFAVCEGLQVVFAASPEPLSE